MIVGGVPMLFGGAAVGDPYFASVGLLLHGDGTNGSTIITDNSPTPKTVTSVGDASVGTAQAKYGSASLSFDGTGDYMTVPHDVSISAVSGTTIEAWIRTSSVTGTHAIMTKRGISSAEIEYQFLLLGDKLYADVGYSGGLVSIMGTTSLSINTWYHVALVISGTSVKIFAAGGQEASGTGSGSPVSQSNIFRIGASPLNAPSEWYWSGNIDDLRITQGVARYTGNFTPPIAAHPDN